MANGKLIEAVGQYKHSIAKLVMTKKNVALSEYYRRVINVHSVMRSILKLINNKTEKLFSNVGYTAITAWHTIIGCNNVLKNLFSKKSTLMGS